MLEARKGSIPALAGLVADVWVSERHKSEMEVTKNPVESGSQVSDHGFLKPRELFVSFGVSNTPLRDNESFGGHNRIEDARVKLHEIQARKQPLTINTLTGGVYENCLITSISWETDKRSANATIFEIELEEIIIVNTQFAQYEPLASEDEVIKQVTPTKKRGEAAVKALDPVADIRRNFTSDASTNPEELAKSAAANAQAATIANSDSRVQLKEQAAKDSEGGAMLKLLAQNNNGG